MTTALSSLAALDRTLGALPAPAEGHVRVYRGQTVGFPAMLPSACRPSAPPTGRLWDFALLHVRQAALAAGPAPPADSTAESLRVLMNLTVWFKVLAQHYGPGSPYLDVTTSPDVALWFALNQNHSAGVLDRFVVTQPGLGPLPVVCPTLKFSARGTGNGWFYVLDVPRADGESVPKHGQLLELTAGPEFVSTCLRVVRQHGGLVLGDCAVAGGDLARFYACPPIPVARPFDGCPFIDRDQEFLFPGPGEDEWYARLLQAPLMPQPSATNGCEYRQSLGVYLVTPPGEDTAVALLDRQLARLAPMARASLRAMPEARRHLRAACGVDPEAATYVQIEIPLLAGLPPPDRWNQSVLVAGLARRTRPRVESSGETLPAVSLENVLIQMSPLETALLDARADADVMNALWLVRRGERFQVTVFTSPLDTGSRGGRHLVGPLELEFSKPDHGFVVTLDGRRQMLLHAGLPDVIVKAFFVALDVLRGLSDTVKPDPYPVFTSVSGDATRVLLPVRHAPTVLTRAKADPADLRMHFLRGVDSGQPYMGPGLELSSVGVLVLEVAAGFEALPSLHDVYGSAREVTVNGQPISLPDREGQGVSARVAAFLLDLFGGRGAIEEHTRRD